MGGIEIWMGFIGLLVGGVIGFFADWIVNERRMKFEAYKDIKSTLNSMHNVLVEQHSNIQRFYVDHRGENAKEKIILIKDYHWKVMEIYKEFRIYFGDLKAYELQSAVYNYYYEMAKKDDSKMTEKQYEISHQALKDAYGLMISEVKLGLVSVKFIKKADRKLGMNKDNEYKKYSDRLKFALQDDVHLTSEYLNKDSNDPLSKAMKVVKDRIEPFESEYQRKTRANLNQLKDKDEVE